MSESTKIEWCDATWNPVTGCTPVSEACEKCYARAMVKRFPNLHGGLAIPFSTPLIHRDRLEAPLHWRKPRRIFVGSMTDLFHAGISDEMRDEVFDIIRQCDDGSPDMFLRKDHVLHSIGRHVFMILTKRPIRMLDYIVHRLSDMNGRTLRNCWLGVTVESVKYLDRIDTLRTIPAAKRFVSFEPLLSPIENINLGGIDWVIVGCETGPGARPMDLAWARSIRDECHDGDHAFFMKKATPRDKSIDNLPEDLQIREIPR